MSRNSKFFQLPNGYRHDPDVVDLPATARDLWVGLMEHCQTTGNGGEMTVAQVLSLCRSFDRGRDSVCRLIARGSLVVEHPIGTGLTSDSLRTLPGHTVVRVRNATRWLLDPHPSKSIPAGKGRSGDAKVSENETRAPARVKTDRQTDREPIRSPSGSDRIGSARAAPRSAGGAARPAPDAASPAGGSVGGDDDPKMTRAEAIAAAKAAIRKGQSNSPHCTGRDTVFSRYDPNRPIIPLTSGFKIDGGTE